QAYSGLAPIVRTFVTEVGLRPERACIGVPCPATEEECVAPNLPWKVDADAVAADIGIASSALINDFTAIGHGIAFLRAEDLETLQAGEPKARAPIGVIGAGTGLGGGFRPGRGETYEGHGRQAGSVAHAPRGQRQAAVRRPRHRHYGHVSWRR